MNFFITLDRTMATPLIFQPKHDTSGLNSELIQHCYKFQHEKTCVRFDKKVNFKLNFLLKSGPQNFIVTHQSYVSFNEQADKLQA